MYAGTALPDTIVHGRPIALPQAETMRISTPVNTGGPRTELPAWN
jgi:hypothetical protein